MTCKNRDPYGDRLGAIWERVDDALVAAGHPELLVTYSVYETDEEGLPVDNLDEVAVSGTCRFSRPRTKFFGGPGSEDYLSGVVESPTWMQVCILAEEAIQKTRDYHHVFLEGVEETEMTDVVRTFRLVMGS